MCSLPELYTAYAVRQAYSIPMAAPTKCMSGTVTLGTGQPLPCRMLLRLAWPADGEDPHHSTSVDVVFWLGTSCHRGTRFMAFGPDRMRDDGGYASFESTQALGTRSYTGIVYNQFRIAIGSFSLQPHDPEVDPQEWYDRFEADTQEDIDALAALQHGRPDAVPGGALPPFLCLDRLTALACWEASEVGVGRLSADSMGIIVTFLPQPPTYGGTNSTRFWSGDAPCLKISPWGVVCGGAVVFGAQWSKRTDEGGSSVFYQLEWNANQDATRGTKPQEASIKFSANGDTFTGDLQFPGEGPLAWKGACDANCLPKVPVTPTGSIVPSGSTEDSVSELPAEPEAAGLATSGKDRAPSARKICIVM